MSAYTWNEIGTIGPKLCCTGWAGMLGVKRCLRVVDAVEIAVAMVTRPKTSSTIAHRLDALMQVRAR